MTIIRDLGMSFYGLASSQSNLDKYATIDFGQDISAFAAEPGVGLLYTTGNQGYDGGPVGVTNSDAASLGCRLKDGAGNLLYWGSPGSNWLLNPADAGLRAQWKSSVDSFFLSNPTVDGLWIDNFVMDFENFPATYPVYDESMNLLWSDFTDFQAAQMVFSNDCHDYVKNTKGKLVVVNAGGAITGDNNNNDGTNSKLWMDQYYANVTGMTQEYWQQFSDFTKQLWPTSITLVNHYWDQWQTVMTYANAYGIGFYPVCNGDYASPDYSTIRYARASFLMEWQGSTYDDSVLLGDGGTPTDIWHAPDTAYDLGLPLDDKIAVGTHAYKREFENGWVYVNPYTSNQTLDGYFVPSGDAVFVASSPPVSTGFFGARAGSLGTSDLYAIDPDTAAVDSIGDIGFAVTGLAFDPTDGTLYGVTSSNSSSNPKSLITIDPDTGAGTLVGALSLAGGDSVSDIDFTSDGELWGILNNGGLGSGRLIHINKATGAGTPVAGGSDNGTGGLAVDPSDDTVYHIRGAGIAIKTMDTSTGVSTSTGVNADSTNVYGDNPFKSAKFDSDSVLWVVGAAPNIDDTNHLGTIDLVTGVLTDVGATGFDRFTGIDAITWEPEFPAFTVSALPASGLAPLTVSFIVTVTSGSFDSWDWDFGDGNTSTDQNPTHTYTEIGNYTATVVGHSA